jgi:hypothetical protein
MAEMTSSLRRQTALGRVGAHGEAIAYLFSICFFERIPGFEIGRFG